jgi:uncharacterized protein (TIGR02996 family)
LQASVYADPQNDSPRLVLADWLMERGDPRGEFIHRQVSGQKLTKQDKALQLGVTVLGETECLHLIVVNT